VLQADCKSYSRIVMSCIRNFLNAAIACCVPVKCATTEARPTKRGTRYPPIIRCTTTCKCCLWRHHRARPTDHTFVVAFGAASNVVFTPADRPTESPRFCSHGCSSVLTLFVRLCVQERNPTLDFSDTRSDRTSERTSNSTCEHSLSSPGLCST
jgi:hypothetical protein